MARIPGSHPGGPGSIPGVGDDFFLLGGISKKPRQTYMKQPLEKLESNFYVHLLAKFT